MDSEIERIRVLIDTMSFEKWYLVDNIQFWKDRIDERYGWPHFYLKLSGDYLSVIKKAMQLPNIRCFKSYYKYWIL